LTHVAHVPFNAVKPDVVCPRLWSVSTGFVFRMFRLCWAAVGALSAFLSCSTVHLLSICANERMSDDDDDDDYDDDETMMMINVPWTLTVLLI